MRTIYYTLRDQKRLGLYTVLAISVLTSLGMEVARIRISGMSSYIFLIWNLFLAFVPFAISSLLTLHAHGNRRGMMLWLGIPCWLLFFPNSPYIITDFFHLKPRPGIPLWFDTILLMSFAWNGLMLGFISLLDIQQLLTRLYNTLFGWVFAVGSIVLGSFGIYLGRFLRWNSWDVLSNPFALMGDILDRLIHPMQHEKTVAVTAVFSVFLLLGYLTLKLLIGTRTSKSTSIHPIQPILTKAVTESDPIPGISSKSELFPYSVMNR